MNSTLNVRAGILVFLTLLLSCGLLAAEDNPPGRVARISYLKGNVSFQPAGQDQWSQATLNFVVTTGDRLYTDQGARAELEVGPYTVRLSENTDLTVTNLDDQFLQLGLGQGTIRLSVYQLPPDNTVEVDTPNGSLTVRAPGKYRVDSDPNANRTLVIVNRGSLEITGGDVIQTLHDNEAAVLTGQDPIQLEPVEMPPRDDFDDWSDRRDEHLAASGSADYVSHYVPGYDDLDSYGHWEVVADYGPIWYPVVPVGWVPYRFGRWLWVDPWGWTWIEDEIWGFCPFHYGRWVFINGVWGWLPGPPLIVPVYAPAFVAFLGGPSFSVGIGVGTVAWFPLGPGEPYFPWYHYTTKYLTQVNITNIRNVTNVTNIINITNINNVHYAYRTVATTAVPANVFKNGEPVAKHVVHVSPQQLAKAQVIPHPPVNPTPRATAPGKRVAPPAVPTHRPFVVSKPPAAARAAPSAAGRSGAPATRTSPGTPTSGLPPAPVVHPRARAREGPPPTAPPRLIVRTPPPPPPLPFVMERHALAEHPGRPLEPRQFENLRLGRPAGPMLDREFPPHVAPVIPERRVALPPGHKR